MAGRKPKPTAVKKLEGNPGKRKATMSVRLCRMKTALDDRIWYYERG